MNVINWHLVLMLLLMYTSRKYFNKEKWQMHRPDGEHKFSAQIPYTNTFPIEHEIGIISKLNANTIKRWKYNGAFKFALTFKLNLVQSGAHKRNALR